MFHSVRTRSLILSGHFLMSLHSACELPPLSQVSVSHIFVLLMYCNDTKLQYTYKKFGCREMGNEQTIEELKEWNREIAHWYRLLVEMVYFYGEYVSRQQVFYTGMCRNVLL